MTITILNRHTLQQQQRFQFYYSFQLCRIYSSKNAICKTERDSNFIRSMLLLWFPTSAQPSLLFLWLMSVNVFVYIPHPISVKVTNLCALALSSYVFIYFSKWTVASYSLPLSPRQISLCKSRCLEKIIKISVIFNINSVFTAFQWLKSSTLKWVQEFWIVLLQSSWFQLFVMSTINRNSNWLFHEKFK